MDKVKFALAGFGRFGRHHANVLASHPAVELVAIAEPNKVQADEAQLIYPRAKIYECPFQLIEEVHPEALSIASPEDTHASIVRAALDARLNIFCEKPLATQVEEARELVSLARQVGVHFRM
ncbi:MAG TPA: Gfo/Idh/MocA family oxidoreductase, partial [Nitrospirales bacterium]|nr:Gfo/Idh/MocA family oxidoreductase [Nitrospirales bacterium]